MRRRMRLILPMLALLSALLAVAGCGRRAEPVSLFEHPMPYSSGAEEFVLLLTHSENTDSFTHRCALEFKTLVEEESNGRLVVDVYANDGLGGDLSSNFELLKNGSIQICFGSGPASVPFTPLAHHWLTGATAEQLYDELLENEPLRQLINSRVDENLLVLGIMPPINRQLASAVEISSLEDFAGLRLRAMNGLYWADLGAEIVWYPLDQAYTALIQRQFEVNSTNTVLNIVSNGLYWPDGYLLLSNHYTYFEPIYINKNYYNKLPAELRLVLETAIVQLVEYAGQALDAELEQAFAQLAADHVTVYRLNEQEQQRLEEIGRAITYAYCCEELGQDYVDEVLAAVKSPYLDQLRDSADR